MNDVTFLGGGRGGLVSQKVTKSGGGSVDQLSKSKVTSYMNKNITLSIKLPSNPLAIFVKKHNKRFLILMQMTFRSLHMH